MSQIAYEAEEKDGEEILEILERSPAKGSIELLYTRRPNAYLSYKKESNEAKVYAIKENNQIIGTTAKVIRKVYIRGKPKKLCYICGLKKNLDYKGNVNWGKILLKNTVQKDIDCYFCSIVSDNYETKEMLEKKRKRTVNLKFLQDYTTYMLAPYFKFELKNYDYEFRQAKSNDKKDLIDFLNSEGRKKDFFPVFESMDQFSDLKTEDFYMLKNKEEVVAVAALWNQTNYRQYIVKRYKGIMKFAKILNPIIKRMGYIKLPKEDEVINFPMLSFFISKDDNEEYYKAFLNHINQEIKKKYEMFVIGTTQSNFANNIYKKLRNIHFDTKIYSIDFLFANSNQQEIDKDRIWLECGLL